MPAEQRNIRAEREILERIVGPKSASVWAFAQTRAHPGPVRDFATRDLVRDAVEEASDQINYGTWGIQQMEALDTQDPRKGDVFAAFATALLHATEAYNALAAVHPAYLDLLAERA